MKLRPSLCFCRALLFVSVCFASDVASAASQTWLDGNANNDWSTTDTNWTGGVGWTAGSDAIFGGTGEAVTLKEAISLGNLTFSSSGYSINGNTLNFAAGATIAEGGFNNTINSNISGAGNLTFTVRRDTVGGTLTLNGTTSSPGKISILGGGFYYDYTPSVLLGTSAKLQAQTIQIGDGNNNGMSILKLSAENQISGVIDFQVGGNWQWGGATLLLNGKSQTVAGLTGSGVVENAEGVASTGNSILTIDTAEGSSYTHSGGNIRDNYNNIGSGTLGIEKKGTGTQILNSANIYTGPTNVKAGTLITGGYGIGDTSAVTVDSGATLQINANEMIGSLSGAGSVKLEGKILTTGDSTNTTFSGVLSSSVAGGGLIKLGTGAMTLSGANTYTGATTVSAGTLYVNGSIGNSITTVASGATLGGEGTIGGNTTVNGTLSPGDSAGVIDNLTFSQNLNLAATSISSFNLNSSNTTADKAIVMANLLFAGTLNVTDIAATSAFAQGQSYDLFNFTTHSGTFSQVNLPTLPAGLFWDSSQLYTSGVISVIPEPSVALLGGLGGLLLLRRRRA